MKLLEERLLRYASPAIYNRMAETFSAYHIHPYDVLATVLKKQNGIVVTLKFSVDFSQVLSHHFSFEQVTNPDKEVTCFFTKAAEKCKSLLMANYYKTMKL